MIFSIRVLQLKSLSIKRPVVTTGLTKKKKKIIIIVPRSASWRLDCLLQGLKGYCEYETNQFVNGVLFFLFYAEKVFTPPLS